MMQLMSVNDTSGSVTIESPSNRSAYASSPAASSVTPTMASVGARSSAGSVDRNSAAIDASANSNAHPVSASTYSSMYPRYAGLIGTATAPSFPSAKYTVRNASPLGSIRPTRCPRQTPYASSHRASRPQSSFNPP